MKPAQRTTISPGKPEILMREAHEKGARAGAPKRLPPLMNKAAHTVSSFSGVRACTNLEAGPAEASYGRFDIIELLHDVSEAGRSLVGENPVSVMDVSSLGPVMINSDSAMLRQIMMGLMSNAAAFTERGIIAVIISSDAGALRLTIADTGRGMMREQINAALDAPRQEYDAVMKGFPAPGLGTVKALVKQLHGSLSMASKPGAGTIVEVSLPLRASR